MTVDRGKPVRKLVTLPTSTVEAIDAHRARGIEDRRFGGPPRSQAEAMKRLVILGLEDWEARQP